MSADTELALCFVRGQCAESSYRTTAYSGFLNGGTSGDSLGNFSCFTYNGVNVLDDVVVGHDVFENFIQPLLYFICSENYYFYRRQ